MNLEGINTNQGTLPLTQTHQAHLPSRLQHTTVSRNQTNGTFADLLIASLTEVNRAQTVPEELAVQSVINPDSVDVHDITVAAAKADLAIRLARSIIDRSISAYREITSLR